MNHANRAKMIVNSFAEMGDARAVDHCMRKARRNPEPVKSLRAMSAAFHDAGRDAVGDAAWNIATDWSLSD